MFKLLRIVASAPVLSIATNLRRTKKRRRRLRDLRTNLKNTRQLRATLASLEFQHSRLMDLPANLKIEMRS